MERASITQDIGQESTLMYAIGAKVKVIGGIYVVAGLFLLLGPGRELLLNLTKIWEGNILAIMALYIPLAGIALVCLGASQLLFAPSKSGKVQTHPNWLPLIHSFPYWLIITAMSLPFFGLLGLMAYQKQDQINDVLKNGFPDPKMWVGVVFGGSIILFFAFILWRIWYPSTRSFLTALMGIARTKQIGRFDRELYHHGDIIRFSMDQIRGERLRVFLNCVQEGRKEKNRGPRATPYVSFCDVSAEQLKRGIELNIPTENFTAKNENYYWEVLVETFDSGNWARFGVDIKS